MRNRHKNERKLADDRRVDEALEETFPASDAPSYNRGIDSRDTGFTRPDELKWTSMGGGKTMREDEDKKTSSFVYLIGGLAVGAVCGLLFAPKKGSELIEDIGDWGRETKERGRDLVSRAKEYIPHRVRSARDAGEKVYDRVKDKVERFES